MTRARTRSARGALAGLLVGVLLVGCAAGEQARTATSTTEAAEATQPAETPQDRSPPADPPAPTGRNSRPGAAPTVTAPADSDEPTPARAGTPSSQSSSDDPGPSTPTPSPVPSTSSAPAAPPPGPDRSALVRALDRATDALPPPASIGLVVLDREGRTVFGIDPDVGLLPASTVKLLTGAAALSVFGPDHRLATRVRRSGPVRDGVLTGSLVLDGGGDPALSTEDYRTLVYGARPHTSLEALADRVAAAGVEEVRGGIVVGPDLFGGRPVPPGWPDNYIPDLDGRRIRALTVDAGLQVTVVDPPPNPVLQMLPAPDPTQQAAARFARALETAGTRSDGDARPLSTPVLSDDRAVASMPVVAAVRSRPMGDLVRFAFERSDNHISDTLFRLVGARRGADGWASSGAVIADELAALGVDTTGLRLTDGSGLSRTHEVSARHVAQVDRTMRAGPHAVEWRQALAVAGEEGTLRRRLRGTVAEGRFLGKTGTLDDVTAIAGTVEDPAGRAAYHVAAIANLPPGVGRWDTVVVFDDVIALLAEDAAGCERVPPSSGGVDRDPQETPTVTVRCP